MAQHSSVKTALSNTEIQTLITTHMSVRIPKVDNPQAFNELCLACGYEMPCPTLRLIEELMELRDSNRAYNEHMHELH